MSTEPETRFNLCETCKHWKNEQSELRYSQEYGICITPKHRLDIKLQGSDCLALDRKNPEAQTPYQRSERFESYDNEDGTIHKRQHCLVTHQKFGCVNHQSK